MSMTVGVTVVMTSGVCSTGLNVVVGGATLFPPPMLSLFHDAQSSQPVAVCSGCQKSGGGSLHQYGGSGKSHASTSSNVGAGNSSSVVGVGAGAPISFRSPVGDKGGTITCVLTTEGTSGVVMYVGAIVSSTSGVCQYVDEIASVRLTHAHRRQSSQSRRQASAALAEGAYRRLSIARYAIQSNRGRYGRLRPGDGGRLSTAKAQPV
jgi:hypothetical protein